MPTMNNARLALGRVQLRDSFVMAQTADIFISHLTQFAQTTPEQGASYEVTSFEQLEQTYGFAPSSREDRKPFVYQDGFAIIPIHGALINRFGGSWGFVTGYQYIRRTMNAALEDDDVKVIVLDVDSPGGEAAGCFELAAEVRAAREKKPILAVVDSLSASAGYAIPSAATRIVATPSSKIGSIGVLRMHMNVKGALDQMGVEVTMIEAPEDGMKTAGSPFRALTDAEKADWQDQVNKAYDDFVSVVAENRAMSDEEVRATKARVVRADEALALRLIDAVKTPSEAVSTFLGELADDEPTEEEEDNMATETNKQPGGGSEVISAAPTAEQIQAAINADRERMTAIKGLPEAAERPKLADTLAMGGYTVEQAKTLLAAAAVETPAAPAPAENTQTQTQTNVDSKNHLEEAMNNTEHPNVGAGTSKEKSGGDEPSSDDLAATILADQGAFTGVNYGEAKQ